MRKIAVLLLCLSMLSASAVSAFAEEAPENIAPGEAEIGTEVPASHKVTIKVKGNADVTLDGEEGTEFEVERLAEPELEIKAKDGEKVKKVYINGEDVTDEIVDGKYKLPPVYQDEEIEVEVETEPIPAEDSSIPEDSSLPEDTSGEDSSTPDPSNADSSSSSSSSSASSSSSSSSKSSSQGGGSSPSDSNPATGIIGGAVGGVLILGALVVTRRKSREE